MAPKSGGKTIFATPLRLFFVNSMLKTLRKAPHHGYIELDSCFKQDLIIEKHNGLVVFDTIRVGMDIHVDSSLSGMEAKWLE